MFQNFIISWFRREAGLLFFTIRKSLPVFLAAAVFLGCAADGGMVYASEPEAETQDEVVVVIDAGHGGEDMGAMYGGFVEKDMTLAVARSMQEELEKYDGIKVLLTRTKDTAMSLEERCEYAKNAGADFFFCIHFNVSQNHDLFGSEVWISAFGEEYSKGYAFADIEMGLLESLGLYSRGIKTRLNDSGTDYYGVIRYSTKNGMPSALIEHCHFDNENDSSFCDGNEDLEKLGKLDAEAVAKYFGLKSDVLGKDYGNFEKVEVSIPSVAVSPDTSAPDVCIIELVKQNEQSGEITLNLSAADYDSEMLYYSYSYDGGETFSELKKWPDKTRDTFDFTFKAPSGIIPKVLVNAYNGYDLYTTSNELGLASVSYGSDEESDNETEGNANEMTDPVNGSGDTSVETSGMGILSVSGNQSADSRGGNSLTNSVNSSEENEPPTVAYFMKVCLVCIIVILAMIWSVLLVIKRQKRKRKRRRTGK